MLLLVSAGSAQTTDILFLGNSYTGYNDLPLLVEQLALSLGDTVYQDRVAPGGYTYEAHSTNPTTIAKINSRDWEFVILQEQSQRPSFPPSQVASDVYPFAEILVDSIRANNPCTEPVFFMTWGRENGDQSNCANWPPVCTYDGMQARLRQSYLEMASDNNAWCAPVGVAWKNVRDDNPGIALYTADGSHPDINGSYLAACAIYATVFGTSPVGASFISTLTPGDAMILQQAAASTVLDSSSVWNIGASPLIAAFTSTDLFNGTVQFTSGSSAQSYQWFFGDGQGGSGNTIDHTYQNAGVYDVILVVSDSCGRSDTLEQSILVSITGISESNYGAAVRVHSGMNGTVIINSTRLYPEARIELYDITGKRVYAAATTITVGQHIIPLDISSGTYVVRILNAKYSVLTQRVHLR
jgi:PKD repeat protein